ncbi:MAG: hypothetical protein HUU50_21620, partial [Candidatus Brocadiae bacterium]|nr:hypothetical protein [Candidatus Brocadiia bacterium]
AYFTWDSNGLNLLAEEDSEGNITAQYVHGYTPIQGIGSLVAAKKEVEGCTYYQYPIYDHRGTVVKLVDENGESVGEYTYDAWGVPLHEEEIGATNRFGWQSNWIRLEDSQEGMLVSPARIYSTKEGRFLQRDYIHNPNSLNLYINSHNNPLYFVDIEGLQAIDIIHQWDGEILLTTIDLSKIRLGNTFSFKKLYDQLSKVKYDSFQLKEKEKHALLEFHKGLSSIKDMLDSYGDMDRFPIEIIIHKNNILDYPVSIKGNASPDEAKNKIIRDAKLRYPYYSIIDLTEFKDIDETKSTSATLIHELGHIIKNIWGHSILKNGMIAPGGTGNYEIYEVLKILRKKKNIKTNRDWARVRVEGFNTETISETMRLNYLFNGLNMSLDKYTENYNRTATLPANLIDKFREDKKLFEEFKKMLEDVALMIKETECIQD